LRGIAADRDARRDGDPGAEAGAKVGAEVGAEVDRRGRDIPHPPITATYDPRVPPEPSLPDPSLPDPTLPDAALPDAAHDKARPDTGAAAPAQPADGPASDPAGSPAARPAARLISRPDLAERPDRASAPASAAPAVPARRRIWDMDPAVGTSPATPPARRDPIPTSAEVDLARAQLARIGAAHALPGSGAGDRPDHGSGNVTATAARAPSGGARARTGRDLAGADPDARAPAAATRAGPCWPVGWIVVIAGPGRGASFSLVAGVSSIGRGADQAIALDFGDLAISRENHAAIVYDDRDDRFLLGHGGKANIVRLNGRPVVSTEEMSDGDEIAIGDTVLRFVAFCGGGFRWNDGAATGETGHG